MTTHRHRNLVAVALVVAVVALAWQHRWTFEDGFINFRVVKQLEAGHGPVFNTGQRVEVFTSPSWLLLLTVADVLTPIRIEWLSVFLGIALTAAGLALSIRASRLLWSGDAATTLELPAGALVIVATAPFWYFATSGLEGGLTFAWLGGSLYVLAQWATRSVSLPRRSWVLLGLGWLVRPELLLFSLAAVAAVVVAGPREQPLRRRLGASAWAWVLPVGYEVVRMGYFGSLLPNTAYAKAATGARFGQGWTYLTQFAANYWLLLAVACLVVVGYVPLLALLVRARDRRRAVVVAWLIGTLFVTLYIVRLGGDYIDARLLLPSLFAFCSPVAVTRGASALRAVANVALAGWAVVALASLRPNHPYITAFGDTRRNIVTLSDALSGDAGRKYPLLERADLTFELRPIDAARNRALPRRTAALSGIGVLGYALPLDFYVFDLTGLADPVIAHFELPTRGLPGHEKVEPPVWSVARLLAPGVEASPEMFASLIFARPLIPTTSGAVFARQVAAARHALQCGDLRRLQDSYDRRLDAGGFLTNIVRSLTLSRVTIPPDPFAAERKFCPAR